MGLFGRRKRAEQRSPRPRPSTRSTTSRATVTSTEPEFEGDLFEYAGPHDVDDAPDDGLTRLDLGSIRLPVPDGAQLQVEMDQKKAVRAVHVVTPMGQLTVNAYAAPKSGGLWREVSAELAEQACEERRCRTANGEWGLEMAARGEGVQSSSSVSTVRGGCCVVWSPVPRTPEQSPRAARPRPRHGRACAIQPMPVRTPLPVELPPAIAQHIQQQEGGTSPLPRLHRAPQCVRVGVQRRCDEHGAWDCFRPGPRDRDPGAPGHRCTRRFPSARPATSAPPASARATRRPPRGAARAARRSRARPGSARRAASRSCPRAPSRAPACGRSPRWLWPRAPPVPRPVPRTTPAAPGSAPRTGPGRATAHRAATCAPSETPPATIGWPAGGTSRAVNRSPSVRTRGALRRHRPATTAR